MSLNFVLIRGLSRYWALKNAYSMDGIPGMKQGLLTGKIEKVAPIKKMVGPLAPRNGAQRRFELSMMQILTIVLVSLLIGVALNANWTEIKTLLDGTISNVDPDSWKHMIRLNSH